MLLNLQTTCSFLHEEITNYLYHHHVYYFNTPARLANFTRSLSYAPIPSPRQLGTIILEIREFDPLINIPNRERPIIIQEASGAYEIAERDHSLSEPYAHFQVLRNTNPHFARMREDEVRLTRNWSSRTFGRDWLEALQGLRKHKVKQLIYQTRPEGSWGFGSHRRIIAALQQLEYSGMVDEVVKASAVGDD
jgi:hypothetical protein